MSQQTSRDLVQRQKQPKSWESASGHLPGRKPTVVFSHKWDDIGQVFGSVKEWSEYMPGDNRLPAELLSAGYGAAWVRVQFNLKTDAGPTTFELVKSGDLKEWSWAFDIDEHEYDSAKDARMIKSVKEIYELTLCVIGANQLTQTTSAKVEDPVLVAKKAYYVRQARVAIAQVERDGADAETLAVLAVAKALLDEEDPERKKWSQIFNYLRSLD
jgi:hypothetical protein